MEVKVLGPLEASSHGRSIVPTAGKPRQILALLALEAGQVVTVPTLIEELWGMQPPRSALTTLQTYILHLRRLIEAALATNGGGAAKDVLITRCGGYQLDVAGGVDVQRYELLASDGSRAAELGDYETASRKLRAALGVWRGKVLVDVQVGARLAIEVIRLEESRLSVLELCIDADLQLGRHYTLLSELARLNANYPMHENLCAQFMLALYRSGQQWRALEVYKRLRDTLVGELGVEPSARLQMLQRAILRSDPTLTDPSAGGLNGAPYEASVGLWAGAALQR
ncbi:MAG: AfsR/SARP family transcriptional regulator [Gammaproteobacteria bacterium]